MSTFRDFLTVVHSLKLTLFFKEEEISDFIPLILDISLVLFILLKTLICKSSEPYIFPSLKHSWPASL